MKIEGIEVFGVAVPLVGEYKISHLTQAVQKSAIVRITASGGAVGLGNVDPILGYSEESIELALQALEHTLAPLVRGMDPMNIHEVLRHMDAALPNYLDAKVAIGVARSRLSPDSR